MASIIDKFAIAEPNIHVGFWKHWSQGPILGSTLTLTQTNGSFLVAFLALFVSFVGTSFFRISCFVIHHILSEKTAQDEIYHQRQAILRNSASGTHAAANLVSMVWSHRVKRHGQGATQGRMSVRRKHAFRRILPLLVHTTITLALFTVAGIFSSRITGMTGDEVLVIPNAGKRTENTTITQKERQSLQLPYQSRQYQESAQYAQECYVDKDKSSAPKCQKFVKQQLKREIDRNATCPFSSDLCKLSHGNIRIDTGYIDSSRDLGVNLPDEDGVRLRHVFHCAPLATQNRSWQENITDPNIQNITIPYKLYNYGPTVLPGGNLHNYSFGEPMLSDAEVHGRYKLSYIASPSMESPDRTTYYWQAEQGLKRNDSDTFLLQLVPRGFYYADRVDDPWFSAQKIGHTTSQERDGEWVQTDWYRADEVSSPMGCTSNIQLCFPPYSDSSLCTAPQGTIAFPDVRSTLPKGLKPAQEARAYAYWEKMDQNTVIMGPLNALGGELLKARFTLTSDKQIQLPDDQWHEEVINMSAVMLAMLQAAFLNDAVGPADPRLSKFHWAARNEGERQVLQSMMIRSTAYANFSVLGLCIMLIVGSLFPIMEALLEFLYVRLIWKGRDFHRYQRLEWCVNGTLQLQRLAHEGVGYGPWENCDDEVPLLQHGKLATLDLEDPKHPMLYRDPGPTSESIGESKFEDEYSEKHSYGEKSSPTLRRASIPSLLSESIGSEPHFASTQRQNRELHEKRDE